MNKQIRFQLYCRGLPYSLSVPKKVGMNRKLQTSILTSKFGLVDGGPSLVATTTLADGFANLAVGFFLNF